MAVAEQKKSYQVSKNFKGVNTQGNRTAIDADEFAWIENVQPIGFGNLKVVNGAGTSFNTWSGTVSALYNANISNNDYIVAFFTNGGAQYYNLTTSTSGTIAASGTFSASGVRIAQWKNERILILDPQYGLWFWNAVNLVPLGITTSSTATSGAVGFYAVTNQGSGYSAAPSVTVSAPSVTGGVQRSEEHTSELQSH